jgi:DNA-binding transcriptional LysR family regulator
MKSQSARIEQLRLRDLLLLDHLDQTGSLRVTAERLHVTQPAVTQALQVLEQAFGVALVQRGQRGQRGVSLTPAGQAALVRLRVARQELLAAHAAALAPQITTLRVGALPLAMFHVMPQALARLRVAMPEVHIELTESTVSGLWRALADGKVDAIVCRLPSPSEHESLAAGVVYRTVSVGTERLVFVAGRAHPLAAKRHLALELLARQAWVLPPTGAFTRMAFDQIFVRAGLKPPVAAISSFSFHSNLQLAGASDLLTVAPESAVLTYGQALKLKIIPADWGEQNSGVVLAFRESSGGNPAVAALQNCFHYL